MISILRGSKCARPCAAGNNQTSTNRNAVRKIIAACVAVAMAFGPTGSVLADEGFMVMQYEFELSKTPKFRQINLTWQDKFGAIRPYGFEPHEQISIAVPLYSANPKRPGLFNRLDAEESEEDGKPKVGIGAVVATLVGLGLLAAYTYAAGKCAKHIFDGPDIYGEQDSDSRYCEAL